MLGRLEYSRYQDLIKNGSSSTFPFITIDERPTDKYIVWGNNSMDKLSFTYYLDPRYGWLILLANPQYTMEYDIPSNALIRVPLPFSDVKLEVIQKITDFNNNN